MNLDIWFIIVFIVLWIVGPLTQLLQIVAPSWHMKLGLMEGKAFDPEFKWYRLEEKATAIADISFLLSGIVFVVGAVQGQAWAIPFGFFTCAVYLYFGLVCIFRWVLLGKHNLSPLLPRQLKAYILYIGVFVVFGLFGMIYLWGNLP